MIKALLLSLLLAQSAVINVDIRALGPGAEILPATLLDGDRATREWLINGTDETQPSYGLVAVAVLRKGRVCVGGWMDPRPTKTEPFVTTPKLTDIGGLHVVTFQTSTHYWEIALPIPACGQ